MRLAFFRLGAGPPAPPPPPPPAPAAPPLLLSADARRSPLGGAGTLGTPAPAWAAAVISFSSARAAPVTWAAPERASPPERGESSAEEEASPPLPLAEPCGIATGFFHVSVKLVCISRCSPGAGWPRRKASCAAGWCPPPPLPPLIAGRLVVLLLPCTPWALAMFSLRDSSRSCARSRFVAFLGLSDMAFRRGGGFPSQHAVK